MKVLLKKLLLIIVVIQMPLAYGMGQGIFFKKNTHVIVGGIAAAGSLGLAAYSYKNYELFNKSIAIGQSLAAVFNNELIPAIREQAHTIAENYINNGFLAAAQYGIRTKLVQIIGLTTAAGLAATFITIKNTKTKKLGKHSAEGSKAASSDNEKSQEDISKANNEQISEVDQSQQEEQGNESDTENLTTVSSVFSDEDSDTSSDNNDETQEGIRLDNSFQSQQKEQETEELFVPVSVQETKDIAAELLLRLNARREFKNNPQHRILIDAHVHTRYFSYSDGRNFTLDQAVLMFLNTQTNRIEYEAIDITLEEGDSAKTILPLSPVVLQGQKISWFKKICCNNLLIAYDSGALTYYSHDKKTEYNIGNALKEDFALGVLSKNFIDIHGNSVIWVPKKENTLCIGHMKIVDDVLSVKTTQEILLDDNESIVQVKNGFLRCSVETNKDILLFKYDLSAENNWDLFERLKKTSTDICLLKDGYVTFNNSGAYRYYVDAFSKSHDYDDIPKLHTLVPNTDEIVGYDKYGNYCYCDGKNTLTFVSCALDKTIRYCTQSCFESNRKKLYVIQYEDGGIEFREIENA